jgi:hypothetical protein
MPMKKHATQSVTSLPPSPDEERRGRMIKYTIAMSIRVVCFLAIFIVPGWWRLIPFAGTIILPYVAVVIANTASRVTVPSAEAPGPLMIGPTSSEPGPRQPEAGE